MTSVFLTARLATASRRRSICRGSLEDPFHAGMYIAARLPWAKTHHGPVFDLNGMITCSRRVLATLERRAACMFDIGPAIVPANAQGQFALVVHAPEELEARSSRARTCSGERASSHSLISSPPAGCLPRVRQETIRKRRDRRRAIHPRPPPRLSRVHPPPSLHGPQAAGSPPCPHPRPRAPCGPRREREVLAAILGEAEDRPVLDGVRMVLAPTASGLSSIRVSSAIDGPGPGFGSLTTPWILCSAAPASRPSSSTCWSPTDSSLRRIVALMHAISGLRLCEATCLGHVRRLHDMLAPWDEAAVAHLLQRPALHGRHRRGPHREVPAP